jgi:hypothetical protein
MAAFQIHPAYDFTSDESSESETEQETDDETDAESVARNESDNSPEWELTSQAEHIAGERLEFLATPGLQPNLVQPENPDGNIMWFFDKIITEGLIEKLCDWTNKRAWAAWEESHVEADGVQEVSPIVKTWKDCTPSEMRKFIAIYFFMGIHRKPDLHLYWSTDPFDQCPFLLQPASLSRDRFKQILHFLRFYDCTHLPDEGDPLKKIRPFSNMVKDSLQIYMPEQQICVDESLVMYKGRLLFRQFIPTKRARFGIKLYFLCESTSGYAYNFLIHSTEAENRKFGQNLQCEHLSFSERVVVELSKDLLNLGYQVFTDNWFSSTRLADFLLANSTSLTGTIRQDRGIPACLRDKRVPPNSCAFAHKGDLLAVKMVERKRSGTKTVHFIDAKEEASTDTVQRVRTGGAVVELQKPKTAKKYAKCMGGVDRLDGGLQPYLTCRKTSRWFCRLGFHLLLLCVRNSWILYNKAGGSLSLLGFLRTVVRKLLLDTGAGRKRPAPIAAPAGANVRHFSQRLPPTESQLRPAKQCRVCSRHGINKKTVYCCPACEGSPGLCVGGCFQEWHSRHV